MEDGGRILGSKPVNSFDFEMKTEEPTSAHAPHSGFKGGVKMAQSSNLQASFTLFKTFLGTGILALPFAYKTAGLGLALLIVIIVGILTTHCFFLLLNAAEDKSGTSKVSLQKLALEIIGDKGKHAVQISMMIMQLGCCVGILIFTRSFSNHVLCTFQVEKLCNNTPFSLFISLALTVPLAMINNMHYFYIPSLAANFFIIIGLTAQMYYNSTVLQENPGLKSTFGTHLKEFNFTELPLFFGLATYAFEGVGVLFSIKNTMEKPQDFKPILKTQMVVLTIIYIVFPTVCLVAIGDRLQDIVFFSLPTDDPLYLLIQIMYAMSALFTYPIQLFPALRIIENSKFMRAKLFNERGRTKNKKLRYGLRLAIIGLIFLVAYSANSFHLFLNLMGSCVFTFIGFIMPIWMYHVQFKGRIGLKMRVLNYVILVVTSVFGVVGVIASFKKMLEGGSSEA